MDRLLSVLEDIEAPLHLLGVALFALLLVRARRTAPPPPARPAGWLLGRVVLAALLFLAPVAGLNYLVNPFGIYATRIFEPIVPHSRAEKMRLYRAMDPAPELVVLGNSSSFTMLPADIRQRTGRPAFNASLHGGAPEDYLAFLRYMVSINRVPKVLIVPVSVALLRPNLPVGFEPHNPLEPYLTDGTRPLRGDPRLLLAFDQTRASLRVLAVEAKGRPPAQYRFDADGAGRFDTRGVSLERLVDAYMATKEWGPDLFRFRALDAAQLSYFRRFLSLARSLGIAVIVYVPPLHPRAAAFYEHETNLPALRTELFGHLRVWRAAGLIAAVYDFDRVESFGGEASQFHDLAHPTVEASRRMLDIMLRPLSPGS